MAAAFVAFVGDVPETVIVPVAVRAYPLPLT